MRIIIISGVHPAEDDIFESFAESGCQVQMIHIRLDNPAIFDDMKCTKQTSRDIRDLDRIETDAIFSCDFFPELSEYCRKRRIIYLSWIFVFPAISLWDLSIHNETNRIFVADPELFNSLQAKGLKYIYYLPFAVNPKKFEEIPLSDKASDPVSFVGSMGIKEKELAFKRFSACMDSTKGYIDGIVAAQCGLYGADIVHMRLPDYIIKDLSEVCPVYIPTTNTIDVRTVYPEFLLLPIVTMRERINLLYRIGTIAGMHTYSNDSIELNEKELRDPEPDLSEKKRIYSSSGINAVIPSRQLHGAVPLNIFEAMACGGFVLSAYQSGAKDIFRHCENIVLFESFEDCMGAVRYYQSHDNERLSIATAARKEILANHTFNNRIEIIKEAIL